MAKIFQKFPDGTTREIEIPEVGEVFTSSGGTKGSVFKRTAQGLVSFDPGGAGRPKEAERLKAIGAVISGSNLRDFNLGDIGFGPARGIEDLEQFRPTTVAPTNEFIDTTGGNAPIPTQQELQRTSDLRLGAQPQQQRGATGGSITVKSGDTLSKIAQQQGISLQQLLQNNPQFTSGGRNPDLIFPGDVVNLGAAATGGADITPERARIDEIEQIDVGAQAEETKDAGAIKDAGISVSVRDSSKLFASVEKALEDVAGEAPEAPSLTDLFQSERARLGIEPLETELAQIDSDIEAVQNALLEEAGKAEERLVGVTEIGRRKGKLQTEADRRIARLQVERSGIARQLDNKLNTLNTVMKLTQADFQNASTQYNQSFTKSLQLFNLFEGIEDDAQKDAKSNLKAITDSIKGKAWNELDADTQRTINNLDIQSGNPSGFSQFIIDNAKTEGKEIEFHRQTPDGTGEIIYYKDGTTKIVDFGIEPEEAKNPLGLTDTQINKGIVASGDPDKETFLARTESEQRNFVFGEKKEGEKVERFFNEQQMSDIAEAYIKAVGKEQFKNIVEQERKISLEDETGKTQEIKLTDEQVEQFVGAIENISEKDVKKPGLGAKILKFLFKPVGFGV